MKMKFNSRIYPLEAVISTCYSFLDKAYIFIDGNPTGGSLVVKMKDKNAGQKKKRAAILKRDFTNELLFNTLRHQVSKNNKKIREYIIGRALFSPSTDLLDEADDITEDADYLEDPLGIAIPWEEKHSKNTKKQKNKKVKC